MTFSFFFAAILAISTLSASIGAYYWLTDPQTAKVSFVQSLYNHLLFTISSIMLSKNDLLIYLQNRDV